MLRFKLILFLNLFFLIAQAQSTNAFFTYQILPNADNSIALQKVIDSASSKGSTIYINAGIIQFEHTIHVKAGVTIIGAGRGSTPTKTPYNGTIFWYKGDSTAIEIDGSNVILQNFILYDKNSKATNGILLFAKNNLLESISIHNVEIFGFLNGNAFCMNATNHAGIGYCSFYDVSIRHAKNGIVINPDSTSFINSNSFYHCIISGGGFYIPLLVNGGNNNIFYAPVIEPYQSKEAHIVVNKGQIIAENLRLEATKQPKELPVIILSTKSKNCKLTGMYSGGMILNLGSDNRIDLLK
jgi:hypothetical protein